MRLLLRGIEVEGDAKALLQFFLKEWFWLVPPTDEEMFKNASLFFGTKVTTPEEFLAMLLKEGVVKCVG